MESLILYLGMMAVGGLVGSRKWVRSRSLPWIGKVQSVALIILILVLGINIGMDDRVFDALSEIGIAAVVITIFAMAGSLLCVMAVRRCLGLDGKGRRKNNGLAEDKS